MLYCVITFLLSFCISHYLRQKSILRGRNTPKLLVLPDHFKNMQCQLMALAPKNVCSHFLTMREESFNSQRHQIESWSNWQTGRRVGGRQGRMFSMGNLNRWREQGDRGSLVMGLLEEEGWGFNVPAERSTGFFQKETPSHAPLCSLPHLFIFFFLLSFTLLCPVVTGALWERNCS